MPDKFYDWLNQRDESFDEFVSMGDKKDKKSIAIFRNYSTGVNTNRDAWCYNFSARILAENMTKMIASYNKMLRGEVEINTSSHEISWTRALKQDFDKKKTHVFDINKIRPALYRPFTKSNLYFGRDMNEVVGQMYNVFPAADSVNYVIAISGNGAKDFSALMTTNILDRQALFNGQCFPLRLFEKVEDSSQGTFGEAISQGYKINDGISDESLAYFRKTYGQSYAITKEDLFYYMYGMLHSEEYRSKYADNLSKQLPRIPTVRTIEAFLRFSEAGRALAELHVDYEKVELYRPLEINVGSRTLSDLTADDYYVTKMKFSKKDDKSIVVYNDFITIRNIPIEAYDYVINGKPALEWVMERQGVKTDKDTGIVNDANLYAIETMNDPAYPLKLFQRVITVSLETMKIVHSLPKLDILEPEQKAV